MLSSFFHWFGVFSVIAFSQSGHRPNQLVRPRLPHPMKDYATCVTSLKETIDKLNCTVPPVVYAPGLSIQKTNEYGVQFYAARLGISYERLNAVISLTQSEEGKKKLLTFFSGLKCSGLPGDPINRKNWKTHLPACPKTEPASPPWFRDSKWANATYHPGANTCLRMWANRPKDCPANLKTWECIGSPEWIKSLPEEIATILKENAPSQQCCYDRDKDLITEGAASGTPDMVYKTRRTDDVIENYFLKEFRDRKEVTMEDLDLAFKRIENKKDDSRASMDHYIMDARIITACFPDWPGPKEEHVKTYQSLGWEPLY